MLVVTAASSPNISVLTADLSDFNVEPATGCVYDSLALLDGAGEGGASLGVLCGLGLENLASTTITSTTNSLTLVFTTDGSVVYTGYKATWTTVAP